MVWLGMGRLAAAIGRRCRRRAGSEGGGCTLAVACEGRGGSCAQRHGPIHSSAWGGEMRWASRCFLSPSHGTAHPRRPPHAKPTLDCSRNLHTHCLFVLRNPRLDTLFWPCITGPFISLALTQPAHKFGARPRT